MCTWMNPENKNKAKPKENLVFLHLLLREGKAVIWLRVRCCMCTPYFPCYCCYDLSDIYSIFLTTSNFCSLSFISWLWRLICVWRVFADFSSWWSFELLIFVVSWAKGPYHKVGLFLNPTAATNWSCLWCCLLLLSCLQFSCACISLFCVYQVHILHRNFFQIHLFWLSVTVKPFHCLRSKWQD